MLLPGPESALRRQQITCICFQPCRGIRAAGTASPRGSGWLWKFPFSSLPLIGSPRSREGQGVGILTCGFWHSYFFLKIARSVEFCRARCLALTETGDRRKQPQGRLRWQKRLCQDVRSGTQDPSFRLLLSKFHDTWGPGDVLAIRSDCEALSLQDEPDSSTPSASD